MDITVLASGSRGNCYCVSDGNTPLLLEAGIPLRAIKEAIGFKVSDVVGCLISHEHMDHAKAAADLARAGIDVYLSAGTRGALGLSGHRYKDIRAREQFQIGAWTVLPFETEHDAEEPLGFLLAAGTEKLLYLTDTAYSRYRFQGLTHLMIEANYSLDILRENIKNGLVPPEMKKRLMRSHFSLENAKDFLRANDLRRVEEIWLLHLSDNNSDAVRFKREIQELTGKTVYVA